MQDNPTISVVIPTMNRGPYLAEAVNCLLEQTSQANEIIIVNNGESKVELPDIKLINIYNIIHRAGASQARNFGASLATCDYISFLDDDDLWANDYLEKVSNCIKENNLPDVVISRLDKFENNQIKPFHDSHVTLKILIRGNVGVTGSTINIKRKTFIEIGGYDVNYLSSQDRLLVVDIMMKDGRCYRENSAKAIYRIHEGEHVGNSKNTVKDMRRLLRSNKYKKIITLADKIIIWARCCSTTYKITGNPIYLLLARGIKLFMKLTNQY